jgi:hypothetical protein
MISGKTHTAMLWKPARAQAHQCIGFLLDTFRSGLDHGALQARDFFSLRVDVCIRNPGSRRKK